MSYDQMLYKASVEKKEIKKWDKDYSLPIGSIDEIKSMFEEVLGKLKWNKSVEDGYWSEGCGTEHGFEINLKGTDSDIIIIRGCSQLQAIRIANKMGLFAFDPQTGEQLLTEHYLNFT